MVQVSNCTEEQMTDKEKIEALTLLLADIIHTLDMKQYQIEDPVESHLCETQASGYNQKMCDILNS
jgi:hypothetical protein